jgi:hypothetical protein
MKTRADEEMIRFGAYLKKITVPRHYTRRTSSPLQRAEPICGDPSIVRARAGIGHNLITGWPRSGLS